MSKKFQSWISAAGNASQWLEQVPQKASLLYHVLNHVLVPAQYVNELTHLLGFSPFFSLVFNEEDIELTGSSRQEFALYFHSGKEAKVQTQ